MFFIGFYLINHPAIGVTPMTCWKPPKGYTLRSICDSSDDPPGGETNSANTSGLCRRGRRGGSGCVIVLSVTPLTLNESWLSWKGYGRDFTFMKWENHGNIREFFDGDMSGAWDIMGYHGV